VKFLVFQPGSTFNLTCEIGSAWNISWQVPERTAYNDRTSSSIADDLHYYITLKYSSNNTNLLTAVLTIVNASFVDTGCYLCQRQDDKTKFSEQYVFIESMLAILAFHSFYIKILMLNRYDQLLDVQHAGSTR